MSDTCTDDEYTLADRPAFPKELFCKEEFYPKFNPYRQHYSKMHVTYYKISSCGEEKCAFTSRRPTSVRLHHSGDIDIEKITNNLYILAMSAPYRRGLDKHVYHAYMAIAAVARHYV